MAWQSQCLESTVVCWLPLQKHVIPLLHVHVSRQFYNRKSELMLMSRATAYRFKVISAPFTFETCLKSQKKSLKPDIFGFQGRSRSSMLVPPESSSALLVMISSKSVSICKRFHARLVDSSTRQCGLDIVFKTRTRTHRRT